MWNSSIVVWNNPRETERDTLNVIFNFYRVGHLKFGIWIGYNKKIMDIFQKVWFY